jgi:hypothetical protein
LGSGVNYSVGYTNKRNSTYYATLYLKGDSVKTWTATLFKHDDYYFSVKALDFYPLFTMKIFVNDNLYKTLTVKDDFVRGDTYILSGKLESE